MQIITRSLSGPDRASVPPRLDRAKSIPLCASSTCHLEITLLIGMFTLIISCSNFGTLSGLRSRNSANKLSRFRIFGCLVEAFWAVFSTRFGRSEKSRYDTVNVWNLNYSEAPRTGRSVWQTRHKSVRLSNIRISNVRVSINRTSGYRTTFDNRTSDNRT